MEPGIAEKIKRYETWVNILTHCKFNQEYVVKKDRDDYDFFVESLRDFAKMWWNFLVYEHDGQVKFAMTDPVDSLRKMIDDLKLIDKMNNFAQSDTKNEKEKPK